MRSATTVQLRRLLFLPPHHLYFPDQLLPSAIILTDVRTPPLCLIKFSIFLLDSPAVCTTAFPLMRAAPPVDLFLRQGLRALDDALRLVEVCVILQVIRHLASPAVRTSRVDSTRMLLPRSPTLFQQLRTDTDQSVFGVLRRYAWFFSAQPDGSYIQLSLRRNRVRHDPVARVHHRLPWRNTSPATFVSCVRPPGVLEEAGAAKHRAPTGAGWQQLPSQRYRSARVSRMTERFLTLAIEMTIGRSLV